MIPYPVSGLARLLKKRKKLPKIRYTKGHRINDISKNRVNVEVFIKILFRLLELMLMDVAEGKTVYFDRKRKSRFFVAMIPAGSDAIMGKGLKEDSLKVDLKTSKYTLPQYAFDPGGRANPAKVFVPEYLWEMLVDNVNMGKKYSRPAGKKFISEVSEEERDVRWAKWKKLRTGK